MNYALALVIKPLKNNRETPMSLLPCIEVEPQQKATASVIWLHGLGADGNDFVPIIPELKLPESLQVRFVFPNAPSIPITINAGHIMPAWYDIIEIDIERKVDNSQLLASADQIKMLIDKEIDRGIPSNKIVLAGFSQGGAVSYQTALTYLQPLAGLLCLSTYFATHDIITPNAANKQLPIQIMHGTHDPMVQVTQGEKAYQLLTAMGYNTDYKTYPMEHAVCPQEIADISQWLVNTLG
jgi:phospholipase/carboxylesterase|tara:strand:- start:355 stop:1071 length:717 start_codon:yes stop_codon:yes gene_type:complete